MPLFGIFFLTFLAFFWWLRLFPFSPKGKAHRSTLSSIFHRKISFLTRSPSVYPLTPIRSGPPVSGPLCFFCVFLHLTHPLPHIGFTPPHPSQGRLTPVLLRIFFFQVDFFSHTRPSNFPPPTLLSQPHVLGTLPKRFSLEVLPFPFLFLNFYLF